MLQGFRFKKSPFLAKFGEQNFGEFLLGKNCVPMNVNLGIKYSTSQIVTLRGPYFGENFWKYETYNRKVLYRIVGIWLKEFSPTYWARSEKNWISKSYSKSLFERLTCICRSQIASPQLPVIISRSRVASHIICRSAKLLDGYLLIGHMTLG